MKSYSYWQYMYMRLPCLPLIVAIFRNCYPLYECTDNLNHGVTNKRDMNTWCSKVRTCNLFPNLFAEMMSLQPLLLTKWRCIPNIRVWGLEVKSLLYSKIGYRIIEEVMASGAAHLGEQTQARRRLKHTHLLLQVINFTLKIKLC